MHEIRIGPHDLVADYASGIGIGLRTTHLQDMHSVGLYRQTAGIRTIQWTDTGLCFDVILILNHGV